MLTPAQIDALPEGPHMDGAVHSALQHTGDPEPWSTDYLLLPKVLEAVRGFGFRWQVNDVPHLEAQRKRGYHWHVHLLGVNRTMHAPLETKDESLLLACCRLLLHAAALTEVERGV